MMESIQSLKDIWKQTTNRCDNTEMFNHPVRQFSTEGEENDNNVSFERVLHHYIRPEEAEREKQYAFSVILMKDNRQKFFPPVYPDFTNNKESGGPKTAIHSEEILIKQLDSFMCQNGTMVKQILIYTYYSPCLKRNRPDPCMFQIIDSAVAWFMRYGVYTYVLYTKSWGLNGPNYFKNLSYATISCPCSVFYPYIEKSKDTSFCLDHKNLRSIFKKSDVYKTLSRVEDNDKNTLRCSIKSAHEILVRLAQNSHGLCNHHLECGELAIQSFSFLPEVHHEICEKLQKEWKEMVRNSSMTVIRKTITEEFNSAVVHLFREQLKSSVGKSSPLRLHCIPCPARLSPRRSHARSRSETFENLYRQQD
uniref:uncharacterized protein LOC124068036 n=1 Tax=Scatophagus argus TaxID=75038 RepID=UPI001ED83178|nr:uncharacterized protein LOC124068036 [Scatophagus argus]